MTALYIVLILYDNRILSIEPFRSRKDAEVRAVQLSSEWYKKDGIASFGKHQLETFDEMQEYYRSDAYLDIGDDSHICIEEVVLKDLP
jgi:hypothetical protein